MSAPCTLSRMRTLSTAPIGSPLPRLRSAILRAAVGRAGMTACIVLCSAAVSLAAENDSLEFSAGQQSPEELVKEARREVISTEVSSEVGSEIKPAERKPKVSTDPLPDVIEPGARSLLMRKWDINFDGRIDEREADIARARMRRERMDMQRQAGNDPLTGRPRGEKEQAQVVADRAAGRGESEEDFAEMPAEADDESPRLPGTTSPRLSVPMPKSPAVGSSQGIPRASIYTRAPGAVQQPSVASGPQTVPQAGVQSGPQSGPQSGLGSRAGWTSRWTQPLTGGARAGAPAASDGYGAAGPQRDLNAGRYRDELPSLRGLTPRVDVSGGLLPTVRQPRQPVAPLVKPPRITAEEIGGY